MCLNKGWNIWCRKFTTTKSEYYHAHQILVKIPIFPPSFMISGLSYLELVGIMILQQCALSCPLDSVYELTKAVVLVKAEVPSMSGRGVSLCYTLPLSIWTPGCKTNLESVWIKPTWAARPSWTHRETELLSQVYQMPSQPTGSEWGQMPVLLNGCVLAWLLHRNS